MRYRTISATMVDPHPFGSGVRWIGDHPDWG